MNCSQPITRNIRLTSLMVLACVSGSFAQTNQCNNNANGQINVGNSCNIGTVAAYFDSDANNDYWDAATGCGATDVDAVWGYFTAVSTSTTITYDPLTNGANPIITIFNSACDPNMTALTCVNAAGNNGNETIVLPTTIGVTYRVRIEDEGSNADMLGSICVYNTVPLPPPSNTTCVAPNPICSGSPIAFVANSGGTPASTVNPGNDYDCLFTSPNPSWYYLEIATPGNLIIDITAGSDVDYEIWGPFGSLSTAQSQCNTYATPQDCSYSTSATEQAVVTGVTTGQVYVLLVTNYANTVQTISIDQASSNTATTNCAIVPLPVGYSEWDLHYLDRKVILTWATESEEENDHFAVQRSSDGMVWETIGVVAGNGTTSIAHSYEYIDEEPLAGTSYYRLMQQDFNGTPTFTSILSVNTEKAEHFSIYPNPAKNNFNILSGQIAIEKLMITNAVGKSFDVTTTETEGGLNVDCSKLSQGVYTLTIISQGIAQSERLMISE